MPIILDPAGLAVFADDSVFDIVKVIFALFDLLFDAFLYSIQVIRMNHSLEGIARQFLKFLYSIATKDPKKSLVHIDDMLLMVRMINEKAPWHLIHKSDDAIRRMEIILIWHIRKHFPCRSCPKRVDCCKKVRIRINFIGNIKQC